MAYIACLLVVFGLGYLAMLAGNEWAFPATHKVLGWAGDILGLGSVIFGFWKGIENPIILREREICVSTKVQAEARKASLEEQNKGLETSANKAGADHARDFIRKLEDGLNEVNQRLDMLNGSEIFSQKTLRAALISAAVGIVLKGLALLAA